MSVGGEQRPAPFVVGVPRSGTTLLRLMLDAHPELTIPPETHFIPAVIRACRRGGDADRVAAAMTGHRRWADFGIDACELRSRLVALDPLEAGPTLRVFYGLYAARQAKPRWGDKTPGYATKMRRIQRALPEAHFIHLIRDGRDVVLSRNRKSSRPKPVALAARRWKRRVIATRKRSRSVRHYTEVRFEDLVTDTETVVRRVCDYAELRFDSAMLGYHEHAVERVEEIERELPAKRGRRQLDADLRAAAHARASDPPDPARAAAWRSEMSAGDVAAFEAEAGDLLDELGYARDGRLAS